MSQRMLEGFALYTAAQPRDFSARPDPDIIATPPGTRLQRIIRLPRGWRLWTATRDFMHGSYLELHNNGRIMNCTARADEGDEVFEARPPDNKG